MQGRQAKKSMSGWRTRVFLCPEVAINQSRCCYKLMNSASRLVDDMTMNRECWNLECGPSKSRVCHPVNGINKLSKINVIEKENVDGEFKKKKSLELSIVKSLGRRDSLSQTKSGIRKKKSHEISLLKGLSE